MRGRSSHCLVSFRGVEAPAWVLAAIADGRVPGVCLFAFNVRDLKQLSALTTSLRDAASAGGQPPPLIGIDQEGGQLMAIGGGATELPGNMALGATRSPQLARAAGRILGEELSALGCNLNFAPVLDLATRPENPVVGLRAFGDDPDLVAELGVAMIEGLQGARVLACAKHFPGHGNTLADSHHVAASVERSLEELFALELKPFEAAFAAGLAAVMTAHVRYPLLDDVPATFSDLLLKRLLRDRLGYDGLVITDALDMHALAVVAPEQRARRALEAGADLALLGHLPGQRRIVEDLAGSYFPESGRRVTAARAGLGASPPAPGQPLAWPLHVAKAREMAAAAITVVSGHERLPLRLEAGDEVAVVTVTAGNLTPAETVGGGGAGQLAAQVSRRHQRVTGIEFARTVSNEVSGAPDGPAAGAIDAAIEGVIAAVAGAQAVILATVDAAADPGQRRLFTALLERGQRPYLVVLRSPVDAVVLTGAQAVLCSYGRREEQTEAAVAVLFGERQATGRSPIGPVEPELLPPPEGVIV